MGILSQRCHTLEFRNGIGVSSFRSMDVPQKSSEQLLNIPQHFFRFSNIFCRRLDKLFVDSWILDEKLQERPVSSQIPFANLSGNLCIKNVPDSFFVCGGCCGNRKLPVHSTTIH